MRLVLVSPQSYRPILVTNLARELSAPMGLLYLASAVREACDVRVLDVQAHRWSTAEAVGNILADSPDAVGISVSFSTALPAALRLVRALRQAEGGLYLIAGGNCATFEYRRLIEEGSFDAVVLHEGERTLRDLLSRCSLGETPKGIPGVVWRSGEGIVMQPFAGFVEALDELPLPRFDDLEQPDRYLKTIVSSRGCTYGCIYCSTQQMWRRWRGRSVGSIAAELDGLLCDYNPRELAFSDDEFTVDHGRVMEICAALESRGSPVRWSSSARVENLDDKLLDAMAAAGCHTIFLGIESGSDRVLAGLRRHYSVAEVHRTVAKFRIRGIIPLLSLMVGIPGETTEDAEATLRLLREVDTTRLNLSIFTPFPGTPVHRHPERYGVTLLAPEVMPGVFNDETGQVYHHTAELSARQIRDFWLEGVGIIMGRQRAAPPRIRAPKSPDRTGGATMNMVCEDDARQELLASLVDSSLFVDGRCDPYAADETLRLLLEARRVRQQCGLRWGPFMSHPLKVQVDLTSRCNLRCRFCYNGSGPDSAAELDEDCLDKLCNELAAMDVMQVTASGGEILCRPGLLFLFLDRMSAIRMGVRLVTNGWFVNDETAARLAEYPLCDVQVSIDGADEAVHDNLRGRRGSCAARFVAWEPSRATASRPVSPVSSTEGTPGQSATWPQSLSISEPAASPSPTSWASAGALKCSTNWPWTTSLTRMFSDGSQDYARTI